METNRKTLSIIQPYGLFRHGDWVFLFMDTDKGKWFFEQALTLPRESMAAFARGVIAEYQGDTAALNTVPGKPDALPEGVMLVPFADTNIPADMPSHKMVGCKPEHAQSDVPTFHSQV